MSGWIKYKNIFTVLNLYNLFYYVVNLKYSTFFFNLTWFDKVPNLRINIANIIKALRLAVNGTGGIILHELNPESYLLILIPDAIIHAKYSVVLTGLKCKYKSVLFIILDIMTRKHQGIFTGKLHKQKRYTRFNDFQVAQLFSK